MRFGVRNEDCMPALGFSSKIEQKMTFKSLYANLVIGGQTYNHNHYYRK